MSLPKNYLDVHYEVGQGCYRVWIFCNRQPWAQCYSQNLFTIVVLAKRLHCAIRADNNLKELLKARGARIV
jgi:hypothetical protein